MSIIAWMVLGFLADGMPSLGYAYAKAIYPGYQSDGILSTMILGIIGAFVEGSLFTSLRTGTLQIPAASAALIPSIFSSCARRNCCYLSIGINQKKQQCLIADWQLSTLR